MKHLNLPLTEHFTQQAKGDILDFEVSGFRRQLTEILQTSCL